MIIFNEFLKTFGNTLFPIHALRPPMIDIFLFAYCIDLFLEILIKLLSFVFMITYVRTITLMTLVIGLFSWKVTLNICSLVYIMSLKYGCYLSWISSPTPSCVLFLFLAAVCQKVFVIVSGFLMYTLDIKN